MPLKAITGIQIDSDYLIDSTSCAKKLGRNAVASMEKSERPEEDNAVANQLR